MELFHGLQEDGATIVMFTHERDIAEHAQRILYIRDGMLEQEPEESGGNCHEEILA